MADNKTVSKIYTISATESIVQYSDGTWELRTKNSQNQVISSRSISADFAKRKLAGESGLQQTAVSPSTPQYTVKQVVRINQVQSLVQKSDGTWLNRRLDLNNKVYSETEISTADANKLIQQKREEDKAKQNPPIIDTGSPGGNAPAPVQTAGTNEQIKKQLSDLRNTKQDVNGIYNYNGRRLTPAQWKSEIDRLQGILDERSARGQQAEKTGQQVVSQERDKLVQYIADFNQRVQFAKTIVENSKDPDAVTRATAWVKKLQADLNKMTGFLNTIDSTGKMPPSYILPSMPSMQDIQSGSVGQPATSPSTTAQTPTSPFGGQGQTGPMAPAGSTGPVSAAQRGEQGIMGGTGQPVLPQGIDFGALAQRTPTTPVVPSTTPPATQTPAVTPTPAGTPAVGGGVTVTNPATGQQVTLPAGIDFAWLASQVPADWETAAREMFPYWYDAFKNDPEMQKFIEKIMTGPEMSDDMLLAELQKTNWWRNTNSTARAWLELETTDPATANNRITNTVAALREQALSRGLSVSDAALNEAALNINKYGFSTTVALQHLAMKTLGESGGPSQLVRGYYGQEVKRIAAGYGVPLSDITLNKWVADIATGNQNTDSFEAYVRDISKNLYPSLSSGFDRGLTFNQMTDPYAQVASNILEIPDTQVDFTDPKWAAAFTMKDDKGQQVQMSFGEWADYLRTTPSFGYEYTDSARNKAYDVVDRLAKMFGAG